MGKDFLVTDRLRNWSRYKKRKIVSETDDPSFFFFFFSLLSSCLRRCCTDLMVFQITSGTNVNKRY